MAHVLLVNYKLKYRISNNKLETHIYINNYSKIQVNQVSTTALRSKDFASSGTSRLQYVYQNHPSLLI